MGRTIAEKILSHHAGRLLRAGDVAVCAVDFCFGQDGTSAAVIDSFKKLGVSKAFDKNRFYMVIDHSSPSPTMGVSTIHTRMRTFAKELGAGIYDVGCGICHQLVPERGHITCGDLVLGADSHTCIYGALNIFAAGVGATDLAITVAAGKNWLRVPETIRMVVRGKLPAGVYAKDIALAIVKGIGVNGATYKSIEFCGEAIDALSVEARLTLSSIAVEMGAKTGLMEADKKVLTWVAQHGKRTPAVVSADPDAKYCSVRTLDISTLAPQVAGPHAVDNASDVDALSAITIDQAFIGTCTNGRLEDLEIAARIFKNHTVHPDVTCIIAPASNTTYLQAVKKGLIEIFVTAGCSVIAPGCGPCAGIHNGILADGEVALSTAGCNEKGRMGNPNASIYLASPATVAASAIAGKIADPRKYTRRLHRP